MPFIAVAFANALVFAVSIIYRRRELKEAIIQPAG
jgi:hypothetical protein